ncbi:MAG: GNAT family N-acetyltransferase [Actinobacteria bacterium ATB1]|nr:GNAT family N-acetyltransferase [Actinobacteria bacterium ATB1]
MQITAVGRRSRLPDLRQRGPDVDGDLRHGVPHPRGAGGLDAPPWREAPPARSSRERRDARLRFHLGLLREAGVRAHCRGLRVCRGGPSGVRRGGRLLGELVAEAKRAGHHCVIARIVADHERSIRLHERQGFVRVGVEREVGRKFGRWLDVLVMQRVV